MPGVLLAVRKVGELTESPDDRAREAAGLTQRSSVIRRLYSRMQSN